MHLDPAVLPDDWTAEQAASVDEFLIALHDAIWDGYGWALRDERSGPPLSALPVDLELPLPDTSDVPTDDWAPARVGGTQSPSLGHRSLPRLVAGAIPSRSPILLSQSVTTAPSISVITLNEPLDLQVSRQPFYLPYIGDPVEALGCQVVET